MTLSLPRHATKNRQPEPRSGHVAVYWKGLMIVYGGYNEVLGDFQRHDKFMAPNEIWTYDMEVAGWSEIKTDGSHPFSGISGATACVFNDSFILFGGFADAVGRLSSVFELNLKTLKWRDLTAEDRIKGLCPSKRDKLTCWQHGNKIIYFGGFGPPPEKNLNGFNGKFCFDREPWGRFEGIGWNSDVVVLECQAPGEFSWSYPCLNEGPSPRAAHAGCKIVNQGYVFGGRHASSRQNDMYYLDLDNYTWHMITYNSPAPVGRSWHILQNASDHHLLLHGGLDSDGTTLADTWIFDTTTNVWHELLHLCNHYYDYKISRIWHTAVTTDTVGEVVVFGGCSNSVLAEEQSCHSNDVMMFRITPLSLEALCIVEVAKMLPQLKRKKHVIPEHIKKKLCKQARYMEFDTECAPVQCKMACVML